MAPSRRTNPAPAHTLLEDFKVEERIPPFCATQLTSWSAGNLYVCTSQNCNCTPSTHNGQRTKAHRIGTTPGCTQDSDYWRDHSPDPAYMPAAQPVGAQNQLLLDNVITGIRPLANKTTAQNIANAPMIPPSRACRDNRVTKLAKTVLHLQYITISLHFANNAHFEHIGYCSRYSNSENGGEVMKGASQ